jgi:hypothetical protein
VRKQHQQTDLRSAAACTYICGSLKRLSDLSAEGYAVGCADGLAFLSRHRLNSSTCFVCRKAAVQEAVLAAAAALIFCDEPEQDVFCRHLHSTACLVSIKRIDMLLHSYKESSCGTSGDPKLLASCWANITDLMDRSLNFSKTACTRTARTRLTLL